MVLGVVFENLYVVTIREVIIAYKTEAIKVHPDKRGDSEEK